MHLEDVTVGQTLENLVLAYGHRASEAAKIWALPENALLAQRGGSQHNHPIGPNPAAACVDACTPDDNLPFYFTEQK